ncbi:MAG: hypothetical protein DRP86_05660 [Candidatus Neomarinimicrobiota bacterium]|nr:hypothetical protein [Candidatus Neomarinimicrobiota bacterium]RKY49234.1 MAG: hypothetical protein DRP86_05660 [Candidatus Neomarinimicrobiota bacterium]
MKIFKKCLFLFFMLMSIVHASDNRAILKSLILPGWGEHSLDASRRGRGFIIAEAALWVSYAGLYLYRDVQHDDMVHYAEAHSGAASFYGSSQYWVDMGSYLSWEDHREEMLENRMPDKIYDEQYAWNWESLDHANTFRDIRIRKDRTDHRMTFLIGGMIFNRLVSVLDVAYLSRSMESSLQITPEETSINLSIVLNP